VSEHRVEDPVRHSRVARNIRRFAVPVAIFWVAVAALTNVLVPTLEIVGARHTVAQSSPDSPSLKAMKHIGKVFSEFDSDSNAMIVLEGDQPLGADAHAFYATLVKKLAADPHIEHVQDFWGDPLTAAGSQSKDGKAALVQLYLRGNQGESTSNESVDAIRTIVADTPPPPGVKAYVTGAAPLTTDTFEIGSSENVLITGVTFAVIGVMLLVVYRSLVTMILMLMTVMVELSAARGVVAFLANSGIISLSTYTTNLLTLLAIAAGADYVIFVVGRYQEARSAGEDREAAYYTMFRGVIHVIVGSGLTIAGAVACLSFTRLPYFQSLGLPAALGVLVALAAALTLGPAMLVMASRFGLLEPRHATRTRGWRRIGTVIVRWPVPVLVASIALALIGLLALPGYKTDFDARPYVPATSPAAVGYTAAERHFSEARLNPELLMIESDHDMRNPADMIVLERVAKAVLHTPGIAMVQSITRPLGTPITHSSIPFQISAGSANTIMNLSYQQARAQDILKQVDQTSKSIDVLQQQLALQQASVAATEEQTKAFHDTVDTINQVRDNIANFDDFFRPLRNYFYWEPHCFDIPSCAAIRSVFDSIDGISELSDKFATITASLDKLNALQPQLAALIPPQLAVQEANRDLLRSNYATTAGTDTQSAEALKTATALGKAFDDAKNDDSFYLPPEAFDNPDFQRGLKLFMSPDGHALRMTITHEGKPAAPEGISHIDPIRNAAFDALKATPLADDLHRRNRRHLQGYWGGCDVRPDDRRAGRDQPHPADHDLHHQKPDRRAGHRRHRRTVPRCVDRVVNPGVAVPRWHPAVLGHRATGGDAATRGGGRLQPAADLPVQRRAARRPQDRQHPRDGGHRRCRHRGGLGFRRDHVLLHRQRPRHARSARHHHRPGPAVRHAGRPVVHDTVHRDPAWSLVLVATQRPYPTGQPNAAALRHPHLRPGAARSPAATGDGTFLGP
jgi:putative drug exporter of the RND superfamily